MARTFRFYTLLPDELRDTIMYFAHESDDPYRALCLAATCRAEHQRYLKLIPEDEQLSFRVFDMKRAVDERMATFDWRNDVFIIPGDKTYNFVKKRNHQSKMKINRQVNKFYHVRDREDKKREKRQLKIAFRKGSYDV